MLSGKTISVVLFSMLIIAGCYEKKTQDDAPIENEKNVIHEKNINRLLGMNTKYLMKGKFISDSLHEVSAATEIMNNKVWGIKFYLFTTAGDSVQKKYESKLLNGSFKESLVKKIRFPDVDHEFLYYNSMNYFMGNTGGEIIAYIIDYKSQTIYYSHLVVEPDGTVDLYLSHPRDGKTAKFFNGVFRKDYPNLKLTSKDPVLD